MIICIIAFMLQICINFYWGIVIFVKHDTDESLLLKGPFTLNQPF